MAKTKKTTSENTSNYFSITVEKKKKLLGFFLVIVGLLSFLSILTYSIHDKDNLLFGFADLFKIFSPDPEFSTRASEINNALGLFGAYLSNFLLNATIGYGAIVFPVILFIWGVAIFKNQYYRISVYISNFLISIALIIATFFGMLRHEFAILSDSSELSGKVGDFLGLAIGRLLGGLGSVIVLLALLLVAFIIAFDIKLESIFYYIKNLIIGTFENNDQNEESDSEIKINNTEDGIKNTEPIVKRKKLKQLIPLKTFGKTLKDEQEADDSIAESQKPKETNIRIIKKEDASKVIEPEPFINEVEPQISKTKMKDISKSEIDRSLESELPDQWEEKIPYTPPRIDLLNPVKEEDVKIPEKELTQNAELLKEKLSLFDIQIDDITVTPGPVITLYEIVPAPGVKISRIVSLEHDIALALAARGIRIIAPIPGKSAIGVEIPNARASVVNAASILGKMREVKAELPLALGKTIVGDVYYTDLANMPHLLIAGSTGSGKSVGINMMITSLIFAKHPSDVKFVIIDPKKIELSFYGRLNKHFLAVSPDLEEEIITIPSNALLALKAVEYEMEKRYDKLAKLGVRNIVDYNAKVSDPRKRPPDTDVMKHYKLPYIVVVIDELADLMITSGKEVEEPIARLAQLARAVGIHLLVATQRPSVNVITGVIKANFPARIAYQTATRIDSRTILDMNGAEQLLGRGDMLFLPAGMPKPIRIQNAFISTEEVEKVTNFIYVQKGFSKRYFLPSMFERKMETGGNFLADLDPMFEDAARVIVRHQQGSVSLLQRKLKLGYSRAARIVDQLEDAGIVGPSEGSKAREVIIENEDQLESLLKNL
ncbi:MAG: DNA translocase FtsK 4TM domain-containing protein [Bacteroidetes bacterium]|nr:DNA translocase FtsK 4TM domain-containing protein [Bacteroidota bacterium]